VPPEDKLQSFLTITPTLSEDIVGPCLAEFLSSDSWQSIVKALIVIAGVGKTRGCEHHVEWMSENFAETIRGMTSDSKLSIRQQAMKTLRALKLSGGSAKEDNFQPTNSNSSRNGNAKITNEINLIDTDDFSSQASVQNIIPNQTQNYTEQPNNNISNGMNSTVGLFDGMSLGSQGTTQQTNQPQTTRGFSFMNTDSSPSSVAPPPTATATAVPPSLTNTTPANDPFDFINSSNGADNTTTSNSGFSNNTSSSADIFSTMNFSNSSNNNVNQQNNTSNLNSNFADLSSLNTNMQNAAPQSFMAGNPNIMNNMNNFNNMDPIAAQNLYLQQQIQLQQLQISQMQKGMGMVNIHTLNIYIKKIVLILSTMMYYRYLIINTQTKYNPPLWVGEWGWGWGWVLIPQFSRMRWDQYLPYAK